jgi:excisionase family DNA binding protein
MQPEFLTIKETAVIFAVHPNTIRRAIKLGFLVAIRIGNGSKSPYRISRKSVEAIHSAVIMQLASKAKGRLELH